MGKRASSVPRVWGTTSGMDPLEILVTMTPLLNEVDGETVNTSMRLPVSLRDAAALAVSQFEAAPSTTHLTAAALRQALETVVMEEALRLHYEQHPDAHPSLPYLAPALAAQAGSLLPAPPHHVARHPTAARPLRPPAADDDHPPSHDAPPPGLP